MKTKQFNNYSLLIKKIKKINNLRFDTILSNLKTNVVCAGSGASFTTAYMTSRILNKYFNKTAVAVTPRELLNMDLKDEDTSIIVYSYSGTSKDTKYIKNNFKNVIIITGRNIDEFEDKKNIFSYYLKENYEQGLILYENIIIPITLLLNEVEDFKQIVQYEINHFNDYNIDIPEIDKIAIFYGDFTNAAAYDLTDKLLETGILKFDIYEKKNFSHGQYNYFMNNKYDKIIYFKQKEVSKYEEILINVLNQKNKLIVVESDYNGLYAEYDLLFKSFIIFNKLLETKEIKLFNEQFKSLYEFEGDFS